MTDNSSYRFKYHPDSCDINDVWGQVKRTVGGKPLPEEQIGLIVEAIKAGLVLKPPDFLLDLCCGNGALTARLFEGAAGGVGVDYSEFLIGVARQRFRTGRGDDYVLSDALDYVRSAQPQPFTKALCYGAFPYFAHAAAVEMLAGLRERFPRIERVYLGQIPDRDRAAAFFEGRACDEAELDDPGSLLGLWYSRDALGELGEEAGWHVECRTMDPAFFAAHYRFDAILTRA